MGIGIIAGNLAMLVTLLAVLALIGLNIVVNLFLSLRGRADFENLASTATQPVLYDVFPLLLLAILTTVDPSHFLVLIWYYVAAVLVAIRTLLGLARVMKA
ncbi:hypothetical protein [Alicyclobacillus pomorum]|jgi:hypothetical protein|uniref:hypothetical protein n=1 Tax=Alicyclobacillus pomorum TaxID=204470 RepID=UPI00041D8610|nr:hypothetical protein [Alicyclobacillus pomorum]